MNLFFGPIRKTLLTLIAILTIISGCGSNSDSRQSAATSGGESAPSTPTLAYPRTIKHVLGETVLPKTPEKLAVIWGEFYMGGNMLSLGVVPWAMTERQSWYKNEQGVPSYFIEQLKQVQHLGPASPLPYERLVELQPDLILIANSPMYATGYEQLSKIAPTIVIGNYADFESVHREIAAIFGKETLAEQQITESKAYAAKAKETPAGTLGKDKVAVLEVNGKSIWLHDDSPVGKLMYEELGMTPAYQTVANSKAESISIEALVAMNPDRILLYWTSAEALAELEKNEAWMTIKAVRNKRVYLTPRSIEWTASHPIGRKFTIDDIIATMTK